VAHIVGTNGNDSLVGTSGVDTIEGLGGNDTLVGLGGSDSLNGGLGNDRYVVGTGDVLSDAGGTDTIETSITWHLAAGFENLVATGTASTSHGGNNLANHITGNAGANWIAGREGNDTLLGGAGGDTFNMSNGAGASYGTDSIDGGTGVDTLDFGAAARTAVTVNLVDGTASGGGTGGAGSATLVSIENVNGSAFNDSITGNEAANFLFGFDGNDLLSGGDGNDRLEGGAGDDWLRGQFGADTLLGGDGNDNLNADQVGFGTGNAADSLNGGAGNDTLDGGFGSNTLDGGLGDDTYYVWNTGDVLSDAGGIDNVITIHTNWTLGAGFENLSTTTDDQGGSAAGFLAGNELDNIIDGGRVNEARLEGRGGDDTLYGSAIDGPHSDLDGGDGNDVLFASTGFNTLNGGAGNDWLQSGFRSDTFLFSVAPGMANFDQIVDFTSDTADDFSADTIVLDGAVHSGIGASGNFAVNDGRFFAEAGATSGHDADDRVIYNAATGHLWYDADGSGAGVAQLIATLDGNPELAATDIAVINGSSGGSVINGTSGDDSLDGTAGDDTINGLGGNDTLVGHDGADQLNGGDGNDVLASWILGQNPGDFFVDTLNGGLGDDEYRVDGEDSIAADPGGIDTVHVKNGDWTLGAGLDNLHAFDTTGSSFVLTGNELDNVITDAGSEGGVIFGMGGNDLLGLANAFNSSAAYGGDGNDTLNGARDSELFGEAGDDVLVTGYAGSFMTGGSGADTFVFNHEDAINDIYDMTSGSDKIQLDGDASFDAIGPSGTFAADDPRFHAAAGATFGHDADDRIVYDTSTGNLYYDADGHFGGAANLIARLQGAPTLTASDIAVINGQDGEVINGTAGDDSMFGTPGNDTMNGLGGNDDLMGQAGNDRLDGGTGNDFLLGESGADHLIGGEGNDSLAGEDDLPYGINDFADTLDGGVGDDAYYIHGGDEVVLDAGGDDLASINVNWTLAPGIENAELTGEGLTIHGNELANRFVNFPYWTDDESLPAPSTIFAGAGNDTFSGGWGGASEIFHGEAGDDLMSSSGYSRFTGGAGADTFVAWFAGPLQDPEHAPFDVNLEIMDFTSGVDQMRLNAGGNMSGLGASGEFAAGDARFHAAAGATGGHDADDRVVYDTSSGNLWYDEDGSGSASAELIARLAGAPTVVATDIEVINGTAPVGGQTINGTANNDTLVGGAGNDTINGLAGADLLQGLGGNDSIVGGTGWDTLQGGDGGDWLHAGGWSDTMTGGAGADSFVWTEAGNGNRDTVTDFASGTDELLFENGTLTAMGATGAWAAGDARFWAAAGATAGHDADDRLVYNTSTGNLYYDADGSGAGAAQWVATITGAPGVVATDITVI
jgi:Ca2+-binding RTX toxin-like protein